MEPESPGTQESVKPWETFKASESPLVPKLTISKAIKKGSHYGLNDEDAKKFVMKQVRNAESNRLNQVLVCTFPNCGKTFRKRCNLKDHLRIHSMSRPFVCSICRQCFTQAGNRDRHERANACRIRDNQN